MLESHEINSRITNMAIEKNTDCKLRKFIIL